MPRNEDLDRKSGVVHDDDMTTSTAPHTDIAYIEAQQPCFLHKVRHLQVVPADKVDLILDPDGPYIQDILPQMSAARREVLISGLCPAAWDELFKEVD